MILGDVGEIVEDEQIEAVAAIDGSFERELAACDLEPLDQIGGAGEEHALTLLEQTQADCG